MERARRTFGQLAARGYAPSIYNLGLAYESLDRRAEAAAAYERYLPHCPPSERPGLRRRIRELRNQGK